MAGEETTFDGRHEVRTSDGVCVWCMQEVQQPDLGCDLKGRVLQLEAQLARASADAEQVLARVRPFMNHLRTCTVWYCYEGLCGNTADADVHYIGTPDSHQFKAGPCSCGLALAVPHEGETPK
jgi:hypothetical protein